MDPIVIQTEDGMEIELSGEADGLRLRLHEPFGSLHAAVGIGARLTPAEAEELRDGLDRRLDQAP